MTKPAEPKTSRNTVLALTAILTLALALRVYKLDAALWYDEIATLLRYVRLPFGELFSSYDSLNNHMFFSLQAKASVVMFGETAWALRLPAMLFGLASVWALWWLAKDLFSRNIALFSALLMAVSYHHIWFSQNARGYTGLLFFGLVATALLVRAVQKPSWSVWLLYMACLVAAMYTHLSAAFLFLAQGLAWLIYTFGLRAQGAKLAKGWWTMPLGAAFVALVAMLVLYAPVLGQMTETFGGVQQGTGSELKAASIAEWKNPLWTLMEIATSLGPLLAPLFPVIFLVILISMLNFRGTAILVPMIFVAHVALTVVILKATSFRIWPRYFFVDIGFICLFLVHGSYVIAGWAQRKWQALPAFLGALLATGGIVASLALLPANYRYAKQDFAGARDLVEASRTPGAPVFALGLTAMPYVEYLAPDWLDIQTLADFETVYEPGKEAWIVYSFIPVIERRFADLFDAYADQFEEVRYIHGTLSGGGMIIMKSVSP